MYNLFKKALKGRRFESDEDVKTVVLSGSSIRLGRGSIGWCANGMPTSKSMGAIFNGLCSFVNNSPRTGFI
jgi:hypothetical protein